MPLTRASGKLYRMQVEETNRPNLAAYLGDAGDTPEPSSPQHAWYLTQIGGVPLVQLGAAAVVLYVIWKAAK